MKNFVYLTNERFLENYLASYRFKQFNIDLHWSCVQIKIK